MPRYRWRSLRFGPARVLDVSGEVARVHFWGDGPDEFLEEDVGTVPLATLPPGLRHVGARMWYVDSPGGFAEFCPRPDGEPLDTFARRWRAAHTRTWRV